MQTTYTYGILPERAEFVEYLASLPEETDDDGPTWRGEYRMTLTGADEGAAAAAIEQGIDAHLEAVQFRQFLAGHKLGIVIEGAESLHAFLRRLTEAYSLNNDDFAADLAASILGTLGIEWI